MRLPRSPLGQRLLFGTLLLSGALSLLLFDHWRDDSAGLLVLILILMGAGWMEWSRLVSLQDRWVRRFGLGVLVGGLALAWWALREGSAAFAVILLMFPLVIPAAVSISALRRDPGWSELHRIALAGLGIVYLGLPALCCLQLRFLERGEIWILLLVLVVKGNDIGAYLVGRKIGRTPLCRISPKKTREGSLGGLTLGLVAAVLVSWLGSLPGGAVTGLIIGIPLGVAGQVGDLAESMLKRSAKVKDSGALIPQFGGALDLLDSILFGAPVLYGLAWITTRWV